MLAVSAATSECCGEEVYTMQPKYLDARRRSFLMGAGALAGNSLLGLPGHASAAPPPEVGKIRLVHFPAICVAPGYLAEELLHAEGFEQVEYVKVDVNTSSPTIASGQVDLWIDAAPSLVNFLDQSSAAVALGGLHAGCYELFAKPEIRAVRDLKGRSVSISTYGATEHVFVASIAAYVGMDPTKDIRWLVGGNIDEANRAFVDGKADAYLGGSGEPQSFRARRIGHVLLDTTHDRPWSQYFCCMLTGNRQFVSRYPVATKRAMRAFLMAADICATQPERAARLMADKGFAPSYSTALEVLRELPYQRWRDANPEDTIRFHALRLHEGGIIKATPQKLIDHGTDWRFFNELKKELKA
jgi:NitT/TauT family transport system substrate-binding protein